MIDQLCTEPNPALREDLEKILQQQRETDKDDAAKIFKYLTDPESLASEIEDQLPNQAHPSLLIPQLAAAGQTNELPGNQEHTKIRSKQRPGDPRRASRRQHKGNTRKP